jgi:ABC-type phosphate transport system substrate-binding protein
MKFLSARAIVPACLTATAAVVALAAPGAANAALLGKCEGASIGAAGSSLQAEAQQKVWDPEFNTSLNVNACSGALKPTVTYTSTSSGKGYNAWDKEHLFGTDAFIGTDNTVSPAEKTSLESLGKASAGGKILTVPVLQGAVAIIVNLPEGCAAKSKTSTGRLALGQETLEKIFNGEITEWSQLTEDGNEIIQKVPAKVAKVTVTEGSTVATVAAKGFPGVRKGTIVTDTKKALPAGTEVVSVKGNEVTLSNAATKSEVAVDTLTFTFPTCNPHSAISTVVREDGSGTTHIFKRALHWSNGGALTTSSGSFTWNELSEGDECPEGSKVTCNTLWPTGVGLVKGNKGEGEVKKVGETPGSIGYANLADARNPEYGPESSLFAPPYGGEKTQSFWVEVENEPGTYADPSSNKDVAARAVSNCKSTEYSNGVASFPPPSVESAWNEVTTDQHSKTYPICGLSYDLVIADYKAFEGFGTSQAEATTVENFEAYTLSAAAGGGQKEIAKAHDYEGLPKVVLTKSLEALPLISWQ